MAEKRVSVRLAAVGGRQVRAELEGVGEAGSRGFGRLSREMEAANARLAAFSRRVRVAAAAVLAAAAAAGVAMVRSGLQTVDAQAKLAQSLGTTVGSIQTLERAGELAGVSMSGIEQAIKDLTRRLSQAAAGTGPAADALDRLGLSANELIALPLDQRVGAINAAIESFVPAAERAAVAGQLFGEEGSIATSRIDTATLRQATEDVLAFGVVVSEQDADQIERTNDAISRLGLIWRGLSNQLAVAAAPALEAVADAMAAVASRTGPLGIAIRGLSDNIGCLATYAATFVAFLAGRWVAGMASAALSVRGLATALVVLRGALIRTGIGALIVGVGELIYQLSQFVARVGGVGEAFRLLSDLTSEVWSRIGLALDAAIARMAAGWEGLKAAALSALDGTVAGVVGFGDRTVAIFQGAYDGAVAIWGSLPGAIGDFAYRAANGLIGGVEAMLNGVVTRINSFIETLNAALALLPEWATGEGGVRIGTLDAVDLSRIDNPFDGAATAAGTAAADAFFAALSRTYIAPPDLGLGAMADDARARADAYREAAGMLTDAATRPLAAWQALKDAATSADALAAGLDDTAAAANGAGGAARDAGTAAGDGAEHALAGWQAVTAALSDYTSRAREIGGDIGQSLVSALRSAEDGANDRAKRRRVNPTNRRRGGRVGREAGDPSVLAVEDSVSDRSQLCEVAARVRFEELRFELGTPHTVRALLCSTMLAGAKPMYRFRSVDAWFTETPNWSARFVLKLMYLNINLQLNQFNPYSIPDFWLGAEFADLPSRATLREKAGMRCAVCHASRQVICALFKYSRRGQCSASTGCLGHHRSSRRKPGSVIADIHAQGHQTLRSIATELNARGVFTRRGGHWHLSAYAT